MRIDATLEALSAVKNLTLDELTALLEAVNEKVKSSTDFNKYDKEYLNNVFDDLICDMKADIQHRIGDAAKQAENDVFDRKFGFVRGDTTHDWF